MSDNKVSIDEFLSARKDFVKSGDILVKASKAPASWDPKARTARFVMSAEVEDRDRDIIIQEGLDTTEFLKNPIAPFSHRSSDFPVGKWSDVQKILNGRPKRTEGTLNLVPEGTDGVSDRLAFHIAEGTIRACSIGFIPRAVERREVPDDKRDTYYYPGYKILDAELVECSPVSIPANPAALAKSAAEGDVLAKEIIEQVLDEWVRHPETSLLMPRAEFERAHKDATGQRTTVSAPLSPPEGEGGPKLKNAPTVEEQGLFQRFMAFVAGSGVKAQVEAEARTLEQEEQLDEGTEALARAVREAEDRAFQREISALEGRLAAKGITASAA